MKVVLITLFFLGSQVHSQLSVKTVQKSELCNILSKALEGEYSNSLNKIIWKPYEKESVAISKDGYAYTSVDSVISFSTINGDYSLAVLRTNVLYDGIEEQCASCSPTLGMALFKMTEGKTILTSLNRSIRNTGQAGMLPNYSLIDLSPEIKGIYFTEVAFQDMDAYSFVYLINESNVSDMVLEFPNFRMLDYEKSSFQTTEMNVINTTDKDKPHYLLQLDISTFESDLTSETKKVEFTFNGRKYEPSMGL